MREVGKNRIELPLLTTFDELEDETEVLVWVGTGKNFSTLPLCDAIGLLDDRTDELPEIGPLLQLPNEEQFLHALERAAQLIAVNPVLFGRRDPDDRPDRHGRDDHDANERFDVHTETGTVPEKSGMHFSFSVAAVGTSYEP